jgi:hypothetical protein
VRPVRKIIGKRVRFRVLSRSGFRCVYCGAKAADKPIEVDHVVPVSKGGSDHESNLVAACFDCNSGKSDNLIDAPSSSPARPVVDISANCCEVVETGVFYRGEYYEFADVEANLLMVHPSYGE